MKKKPAFIICSTLLICLLFFAYAIASEKKDPDDIIADLFSSNTEEIQETFSYLSNAHKKPISLLPHLSEIILSNADTSDKNIAIKAISYFSYRQTIPFCLEILKKTRSFIVKKNIIDYLAKSHDKKIVHALIKELDNPFYSVRESVILALKAVGDDRMFPRVLNMMEHENPLFRVYALQAIFHMYDLRFYGALINLLKDKNKSIRYYVLRCIEKNRLSQSLRYVRKTALRDNNWEVRIRAIHILGIFGDREALYVLLQCLKDENREVRYYSALSLGKLRFKASAYPLSMQLYSEVDDEIKSVIMKTMIALKNAGGYKGLERILLKDENAEMRIRAAYALGSIRFRKSSLILARALTDNTPEVRAEVCNSLGFYRTGKNRKKLLDIVNDDLARYVRSAALYSIKRMGGKFFILPLFDMYGTETDAIFKEKLRQVLRALIKESA